jgi:hypothetical protein
MKFGFFKKGKLVVCNNNFLSKFILMFSGLILCFGITMFADGLLSDSFKRISLAVDCLLTVFVGVGVAKYLESKKVASDSGQS